MNDTTLYAATFQDGVRNISLTNPGNWDIIGNDFGGSLNTIEINGNDIYAGQLGVYLNDLTNAGLWQRLGAPFGSTVSDLLFVNNELVSASTGGIKVYDANADSWNNFGQGYGNKATYALALYNTDTLLAGADDGIYSNNAVTPGTWQKIVNLTGPVRAILPIGDDIYAATATGVFLVQAS